MQDTGNYVDYEHVAHAPDKAVRAKAPVPLFSVIIAVYNDWVQLNSCLHSLAQQTNAPRFEVIVVDDGGNPPPASLDSWNKHYPFTLLREAHTGISGARNRGIKSARGEVLLIVDADCKLYPDCLEMLASAIKAAPRQNSFQLRLVGDCSRLVGRAESLRLATIQDQFLQPNGCIRYLDTSGAAIRRARVNAERGLFDVNAHRGEDTLLLTELMRDGELPLFVAGATVQHAISLSLKQYLFKAVRAAYLEGNSYNMIASKGINIRVSHRKRLSMLMAMWKLSRQSSIGASAWFLTAFRQALARGSSYLFRFVQSLHKLRVRTPLRPASS